MKKHRLTIIISAVIAALIVFIIYVIWANTALEVTEISVYADDLPKAFNGIRIVQISDLHSAEFGENNQALLNEISELDPDMIVLTGDMYDDRCGSCDSPVEFSIAALEIAPTYFITGNHDVDGLEYTEFIDRLREAGITVLENGKTKLERDGEYITIAGIDDPLKLRGFEKVDEKPFLEATLDSLISEDDGYTILLSHRPEFFDTYISKKFDLVFSGHAHGGQFRLPFIGGLFAPHQGVFPKYDAGLFEKDGTAMIVSRGLGNSSFPIRLFNRPEIIAATLYSSEVSS